MPQDAEQILAELADVAEQLCDREDLIRRRNRLIKAGSDADVTYYRMARVLGMSDQAVAAVAKKEAWLVAEPGVIDPT